MPTTLTSQIRKEEQLDIAYKRVQKLDAPLLIIGLGGTGSDAVQTIKNTLARRFELPESKDGTPNPVPRRTAYLVIDSDSLAKGILDNSEFVNISLDGISELLKAKNHDLLTASEKSWIHRDLHSVGPDGGTGAGTNRAAARLMLERNYTSVYNAIVNSMNRLVSTAAGSAVKQGSAQIIVVTGVGGGTGSGTFLDMGQILRYIMRTESSLSQVSYNLSCFLIMPDLTISHLLDEGASAMVPIVQSNGYAALKELDFWMDYDRHHTNYVMNYMGVGGDVPVVWGKPFDHVSLMSGTNVAGTLFEGSYAHIQRTIAENLLHYMAQEKPVSSSDGTATYSFLSYENNLERQLMTVQQNPQLLPLNYAYRAVGAYSKRIPKGKILYAEGKLLFKTFIPMRDTHGKLVPNDSLLHDGKAQQRFSFVAKKSFQQLYNDFAANVPFPKICEDFAAKNTGMVTALKKLNTPLHLTYEHWRETSVASPARTFAENYKQEVWAQFRSLCRNIMADPAFGPFSLRQYLEDPGQSLLVAFTNYANNANGMVNNLNNSIAELSQVCVNSYSTFLNPPLLSGTKAVQNYLDALRNLYDTVRQRELARQYAHALQMTVRYIKAYIADGLIPLCKKIIDLETEFGDVSQTEDKLGSDLFEVDTLDDEIQSAFTDANKQSAVTRGFLGKLCDSSFDARQSVDVDTCGLVFTFREDGEMKTLKLLKEEMDACFLQINSQSLDSIMALQCADPDPAQQIANQQDYIDDMARSVVNSAMPMFSLSAKSKNIGNNVAQALYFSVPEDSPTFLEQLTKSPVTAGADRLTPKQSSLTDHIYCNVTWDGIPLYSYSQIDSIQAAYEKSVITPNGALALHLVWNGDANSDFQHNWCKLPSPAPFYLFGATTSSAREANAYEEAHKLADRALASGMLTINSTVEKPDPLPTYTFRVFRMLGNPVHNEELQQQLNEVLNRKDPITGSAISPDKKLAALADLLKGAEKTTLQAVKSPTMMSLKLGFDSAVVPIDPFDATVNTNPVTLRTASDNYYKLTVEYATHLLLQNPALLYEVGYQIESFEAIAAAINDIQGESKTWEPRIAYAGTFARLYTYGFVQFDMMGNPTFVNDSGEKSSLIQPAIFKADLANCKPVVKAVGAAADMDPAHAIRRSLEFKLGSAEKAWDEAALQSRLTGSQISEQITRMEDLLTRAVSEHKVFSTTKQNDPTADVDLLDKQIALLTGVEAYLNDRLATLRSIPIDSAEPAVTPVTPVEPVTPVQPAGDTWTCPNCGKTGLTGKFCPECGSKPPESKPAASATWFCPECGKSGLTGKFCPECGTARP